MITHNRTSRADQLNEILNKIPIFLSKTYRIVDNPKYKDIIQWTPDGNAFVIKDIARLTNQVFSEHFKHNNFLSFIRQLNMYGFRKIGTTQHTQASIFQNQYFKRDDLHMLPFIKRKNAAEESQNHQIVAVPNREQKLQKEVADLRSQHQELQNMTEMLLQQNKSITAQNKQFLSIMTNMKQKYRKKLETIMLLFLFSKKNKPDQFNFPPQLNYLIQTLEQINNNGQIRMLPQKKTKHNHNLPMLTQGDHPLFYSDGQRSEIYSNFDKEESDDIFKVMNNSKSNALLKRSSYQEENSQKNDEELWKNGIPVSPLSARSIPHRIEEPTELQKQKWRKLQNSDSQLVEQPQAQ